MARRKATGTSRAASSRKPSTSKTRKQSATKSAARSAKGTKKGAAAQARGSSTRRVAAKRPSTAKTPIRKASSTVEGRGSKVAGGKKAKSGAVRRAGRKPARTGRRREEEMVPTPPSSLNMNRHGSAARSGRAEIAEERAEHATMTPAITGGDVDADVENAYFSGDEAPGGDNPTPDQDIVDDIGRALGVEYQDNEELRASDKVAARDKHRWELDPASAEDYKEREKK